MMQSQKFSTQIQSPALIISVFSNLNHKPDPKANPILTQTLSLDRYFKLAGKLCDSAQLNSGCVRRQSLHRVSRE